MATHYNPDGVNPSRRRSQTPFPSSSAYSRPSSPYASTPRTPPDSASSLNNLMANHLFPTLLKQNPDRPLIINLGTLNLSDTSSSGDDDSFATATTAASLSGTGGRYTYRDPPRPSSYIYHDLPSARSSSYYYRPSSYSASFTPIERPETYVQYTRPSTSSRGGRSPVNPSSRGSGGPHLSPASSRGTSSRGPPTSYYREEKPGEYGWGGYGQAGEYHSRQGGYGRTGEGLVEREYCGGCCKYEVLGDSGLCEECVFFVPKTAGRGRRDVGDGVRVGFEGVRYVDGGSGEKGRKRGRGMGREAGWERRGSHAGSVYYGGMDE